MEERWESDRCATALEQWRKDLWCSGSNEEKRGALLKSSGTRDWADLECCDRLCWNGVIHAHGDVGMPPDVGASRLDDRAIRVVTNPFYESAVRDDEFDRISSEFECKHSFIRMAKHDDVHELIRRGNRI